MINYRLNNAKNLILDKNLTIFVIVFFQFFGTLLFTYSNLNLLNLKNGSKPILAKIFYGFIDFGLSMLMCISYTRQFAGGVYNPAVVVFRMLRKTDRFKPKIGFIYIASQVAGSIVGAVIALYLDNIDTAPITGYLEPKTQARHFGTEMVGGFVLTFLVQIVSEKSMTFIDHNRQFYICLPLFYIIAKTYSKSSNCVSPAFGISFQLVYSIKINNWEPMAMSYIIIFGPIAGALLSVAMFELVLRPLFPVKEQLADLIQEKKIAEQPITLQQAEKQLKMKNRWSLIAIMKDQQKPQTGGEYDDLFHHIVDQDLDDQIKSNSDDQQEPLIYGDFPNPRITGTPSAILQIRRQAEKQFLQEQKMKQQISRISQSIEHKSISQSNKLSLQQSLIEHQQKETEKEQEPKNNSKPNSGEI